MEIDFNNLDSGTIYSLMTQMVIPRPIAWVLSENEDKSYNLAPFSYFSPVSSDPPLLMISIGKKRDGTPKDSRENIIKREDFIVHIPSWNMLHDMNASAASWDKNISEVDKLNLKLETIKNSPLPILAGCHLALVCKKKQVIEMGTGRSCLIIGKINSCHINNKVIADNTQEPGKLRIDPATIDPIARLGGPYYARIGSITHLKKPE